MRDLVLFQLCQVIFMRLFGLCAKKEEGSDLDANC